VKTIYMSKSIGGIVIVWPVWWEEHLENQSKYFSGYGLEIVMSAYAMENAHGMVFIVSEIEDDFEYIGEL